MAENREREAGRKDAGEGQSPEPVVLCGANSYQQKYYFNRDFERLPESIRQELQIMCVMFTEDIGGVLMLQFTPEGELEFKVEADESDYLFDEIGSGLKIRQYQREKRELLESLEMFYRVFFLGMDRDALLAAYEESDGEDSESGIGSACGGNGENRGSGEEYGEHT